MREFITVLVVIAVLGSAAAMLKEEAGQQLVEQPRDLAKPFEWAVYKGDVSEGPFLTIHFDDGRVYQFNLTMISSAKFFPEKLARRRGINNPFIEIQTAGIATRIDIDDDTAGRQFAVEFNKLHDVIHQSKGFDHE